jgi:hypothetical protein
VSKRPDVKELARKRLESSVGLQSQMFEGMSIPKDTQEGTHNSTHEGTHNSKQLGVQKITHNDVQLDTHIGNQKDTHESTQDYTQLEIQKGNNDGAHLDTNKDVQSGIQNSTQKSVYEQSSAVAAFDALYQNKQAERIERKTFVVRKDLVARLEKLAKKKPRGFQTFFINYILERALDEAEKESD